MKTNLPVVTLFMVIMMSTPALAAKDDKKGYGAGGTRADHASEQGLEKGKAWAGTKEKAEKKPKKDKKSKN